MDDEQVLLPEDVPSQWGSDVIAETIRATGVPYVALNPGASYRGLHDSLVNYLGNRDPQMLLCLHEEHAVAIAHGYAKVTDRPMAAAVHSNVGLMHATMAVFNAYCDRAPMLLLGATGPVDADSRRPWIDWIHTAADQAALVRPYVKWDDQPASVRASAASLLRGNQLTRTHPTAPVYVCFDAAVQEQPFDGRVVVDPARYAPLAESLPSPESVAAAAELLAGAQRPVILAGRGSRDQAEWDRRIALAERLGAPVLTDLKVAAGFPTDHPLHAGTPGLFLSPANNELLRGADVILSLDWLDLGGTLRQATGSAEPQARVVSASVDHQLFNGWTKNDHFLAAVDVSLQSRPDAAVAALLERLPERSPAAAPSPAAAADPVQRPVEATGPTGRLTVSFLTRTLREATRDLPVTLVRTPFAWNPDLWPVRGPLDYLGTDGGGGIGSGPGLAVGAALALAGRERLAVAVLGDGDYVMGVTALWTAARYDIPLLVVVANNNSFFNDELHQDRVARARGRAVENAHVGMRLEGPEPDLAQLASAQGVHGIGPVRTPEELVDAMKRAVDSVLAGRPTVVDVRVERGYSGDTAAAIAERSR
ncbi:thiamine pyrophosphate-binding protein [Geodermatophilus sp. CPCC 206100]|uniref:thiamine pyrophosphate-binding protein n=1 Tax=Geodermatophilus sp. CPCC 206100 TaxID=3020054 RepID=UPI003B009268